MGPLQLEGRLVRRQPDMDDTDARNADAPGSIRRCLLDILRRRSQVLRLHRHLQNSGWLERSQAKGYPSALVLTQALILCLTDCTRAYRNRVYSVSRGTKVCCVFFRFKKISSSFNFISEISRNSEKSQRSQLDLCVVVFRTRSPAAPEVGRLVEHSKRQVRGFVGCHKMLERDLYIVVCLAFNHWHTGMEDTSNYPEYVLAIHSSKRLLVEQISPPAFVLADAIISLTLAKGQRHEVR